MIFKIFKINFLAFKNFPFPLRTASFGCGQINLPGRNFARFILMMFIWFCLVMRTAFQGKQFEFMTKEKRRPDVQTIEEMIVQNFSLHMQYANISLFKDMEFMRR